MQAPAGSVPHAPSILTGLLIRSWEYRHPGSWASVRLAYGIFNVGLGVVLLYYGFWVAAVPLAGMVATLGRGGMTGGAVT
jgi:hypothetical protein